MFNVITRRDTIRGVVKAWKLQYDDSPHNDDGKRTILRMLEALDLENVSREAVDGIIGNKAWTELRCHTCDEDNEKVVHLKDTEYYELFCEECLTKMLALLKEKGMCAHCGKVEVEEEEDNRDSSGKLICPDCYYEDGG